MLRAILVLTLFAASLSAADEPQDWSGYALHSKISGTIVSGGLEKVTLEIPKLERRTTGGNNGNNGNNRNRNRNRNALRLGHEEIDLPYAPAGIVRWEKLQPGFDGKMPTAKALEALRLPVGAPGYAAEKTELRAGLIVEVHLVRPREITAAKATPKDLSIKYVIIQGEAPRRDEPKKKN
jgi:hypothetical protein